MMNVTAAAVCLLLAVVCFLLAAFGAGRISWRDLGFAFFAAAFLLGAK